MFHKNESTYWRAGASQPSRSAGTIFLYVMSIYPGAAHTVRTSKYALVGSRARDLSPYRNVIRNSK